MPITGPDPACRAAEGRWTGAALEGAEVRLRVPVAADIPALVELAGDHAVARTTATLPHPYDEAHAHDFLDAAREGRECGSHLVFAVERRAAPGLVGCAGLMISGGDGEIGYWIGRAHWGRGIATHAVRALLRLGFGTLGLARITAEVMAENPASARVLEKAGLVRVGEGSGCRGRCSGAATVHYAMTGEDWLARERTRPKLLVAAVALVDGDGRVLLARRPEGRSMAGQWEFPGGKVRDDETPEAALVRELDEELGLDVTGSCLAPLAFASHAYEDFHLLMPLYVCRAWKGTPEPREGQTLKWVRPHRMGQLPMPPADVPLVALLRDFLG